MMKGAITKVEAKEIYEENISYIYKATLFLTGSKVVAEDISQEVFLKAFEKYSTFDRTKPLKPWLYQIMLNMVRNQYRGKGKVIDLDEMDEVESENPLVEQVVLKNEEDRQLWERINQLSIKLREVVVLHFYLDMKLEEAAKILKIPVGTCKSRLNAALNKLRQDEQLQGITYLLRGHEV